MYFTESVEKKVDNPLLYIPIVITVLILPLIVKNIRIRNYMDGLFHDNAAGYYTEDTFLVGKMYCLYIAASIAVLFGLVILLRMKQRTSGPRYFFLPLGYLVMVIISWLFSDYKKISFYGAHDLMQGLPVIAAYLILYYYAFILVREEKSILAALKVLVRSILVLAFIYNTIGLFQLFGHDPFKSGMIRHLLNLKNSEYTESFRIYCTSYHPDYTGVLLSLMIPILLAGGLVRKRGFIKMIYYLTLAAGMICLLGTQTRSAMVALVCSTFFVLFCAVVFKIPLDAKARGQRVIVILTTLICFFLAAFMVNMLTKGSFIKRITKDNSGEQYSSDGINGIECSRKKCVLRMGNRTIRVSWDLDTGIGFSGFEHGRRLETELTEGEQKNDILKSIQKKTKHVSFDIELYRLCLGKPEEKGEADDLFYWQQALYNNNQSVKGYCLFDGRDLWFVANTESGYFLLTHQGFFFKKHNLHGCLPTKLLSFCIFSGIYLVQDSCAGKSLSSDWKRTGYF